MHKSITKHKFNLNILQKIFFFIIKKIKLLTLFQIRFFPVKILEKYAY